MLSFEHLNIITVRSMRFVLIFVEESNVLVKVTLTSYWNKVRVRSSCALYFSRRDFSLARFFIVIPVFSAGRLDVICTVTAMPEAVCNFRVADVLVIRSVKCRTQCADNFHCALHRFC